MKSKMIPSLRSYRDYADNWDMKEYLFGSRTARLPDDGLPEQKVHGVVVYVKPKPEVVFYQGPLGRRVKKTSRHRIMAVCTECGEHVSAGRLHQHTCRCHEIELDDGMSYDESWDLSCSIMVTQDIRDGGLMKLGARLAKQLTEAQLQELIRQLRLQKGGKKDAKVQDTQADQRGVRDRG